MLGENETTIDWRLRQSVVRRGRETWRQEEEGQSTVSILPGQCLNFIRVFVKVNLDCLLDGI